MPGKIPEKRMAPDSVIKSRRSGGLPDSHPWRRDVGLESNAQLPEEVPQIGIVGIPRARHGWSDGFIAEYRHSRVRQTPTIRDLLDPAHSHRLTIDVGEGSVEFAL